jgi:hypothetical protein
MELLPGAEFALLFNKEGEQVQPIEPIPVIKQEGTNKWPPKLIQMDTTYEFSEYLTQEMGKPSYQEEG